LAIKPIFCVIEYVIGIYSIINLINGKRYIGSSLRIPKRFNEHRNELRRGVHKNPYLQNSWNKNGPDKFKFEVIEQCDVLKLIEREEYWIEFYKTYEEETGYNLSRCPSRPRLGRKARPETIERMRASLSGKNHPNWGKKMAPEWIAKMKKAVTGVAKPNSGAKNSYKILSPSGQIVTIEGLRKFCRANDLTPSMLLRVISGKQDKYKGWRAA
jgi:group I intron endonuclease